MGAGDPDRQYQGRIVSGGANGHPEVELGDRNNRTLKDSAMHSFNAVCKCSTRARVRWWLCTIVVVWSAGYAMPARANAPNNLFRTAAEGSTYTVDHAAWDRLLRTYVRPDPDGLNRVDYAGLKRMGLETLKGYLRALEEVDPRLLDRPEQFALLANLYNAKTIEIVADRYPVKSIKDVSLGGEGFSWFAPGPWKAKVVKIRGVALSLDDIEHAIMRPTFKDPRVHYALNCASIGCPNLGVEAFTGARLNDQLEAAARAYVNSRRGVALEGERVVISSIYIWYKGDFGGGDQGVLDHLRRYAAPALARKLAGVSSLREHMYEWGLNE